MINKNPALLLSIISVLSLSLSNLFAQDVIYKKDKTKIDAKVLEIGTSDVKYKPSANPDGPVYTINKFEISTIVFQNGTFEVFSAESAGRKKIDSLSVNFCRNYIGVDIARFITTSVGMIYEHTFGKKGMCALRISFSAGLRNQKYYYDYGYPQGNVFETGLDFLYFPTGQGRLKYYAAPYVEWGLFRYRNYVWGYPYYNSAYVNGQHLAGGIKNGIMYQPTRHFCLSADFGFGIQNNNGSNYIYGIRGHSRANIIIGYRF